MEKPTSFDNDNDDADNYDTIDAMRLSASASAPSPPPPPPPLPSLHVRPRLRLQMHLQPGAAGSAGSSAGRTRPLGLPTAPQPSQPPQPSQQPQAMGAPALPERRRPKPGILRLDMSKPRRSSGGSVEFRSQPQMLGQDSGSPGGGIASPHQLSVTWATPPCDVNEPDLKLKPMQHDYATTGTVAAAAAAGIEAAASSTTSTTPTPTTQVNGPASGGTPTSGDIITSRRPTISEDRSYDYASNLTSPVDTSDYPIPFRQRSSDFYDEENYAQDDEEDYSISVSAIMQRRASIRGYRHKRGSRSSRRASSPMDHIMDNIERRRSSVYTTSSDEGTNQESTQEQIFENIRLHKEVIQSVKLQPWPMRKKLKLVRQAKMYVARHEGALQERFAMSRSTRDLWARFKILMAARWRHWKREIASFLTVLIPWELRIKEIESHFGSGVASYFTFLRWLMWVNIMIAIPLVAFVIGPEYFATKKDETDPRKKMPDHELKVAGNLFTIWEFEGYLKYSPMFYGYYSHLSGASSLGYKLPLAYFLTAVVVYIYSFVATLRKMAENSRNSKLSSKDDECTFSWKLFTGWDFMIGHAETAHNRIASVVVGFKEALLEEAEKKKDNHNWRIILQRILVNILVMGLLAASGATVVLLVNNAEKLARQDNWLSRNAVNVVMTLLSFFLPMIFEALGLFEKWHPRQQLRLQLARIMILNLLNLYSLMFSFIYQINSKEKPLQDLKRENETTTLELEDLLKNLTAAVVSTPDNTTLNYLANAGMATTALLTGLSSGIGIGGASSFASTTVDSLMTTVTSLYSPPPRRRCYNVTVKCSKQTRGHGRGHMATTTFLLINLTTTMMPTITTEPPITTTMTPEITTFTPAWTTTTPTTTTTTTTTTEEPKTVNTTLATTTASDWLSTSSSARPSVTPGVSPSPEATTSQGSGEEEEDSTVPATTIATTTTSTPSLGNDSFFEYYDYFAGMPVDLDAADAIDDADGHEAKLAPRQRRQAANDGSDALSALGKSKYSRRRYGPTETTTEVTTTTTSTVATTIETTTDDDGPLWVPYHKLEELGAYFLNITRSTTTIETPTTSISEEPTTTPTTTTTTNSDTEPPSNTEPMAYFIDEEEFHDLEEENFYNDTASNETDDENVQYCIVRICPPDVTTTVAADFDTTTPMTTDINNTDIMEPPLTPQQRYQATLKKLNDIQRNLTNMCWETSLGQELSKVIVFDGIMGIAAPLCIDFLRGLFVRYVNPNWCWDMEKTFPQYGDFKIAENILTLIYNQGQVWMGIFFSPGLVLINLVKLIIMMYFRSWIVLTCNVPHEVVFKASKSNNFYLTLLLTMLFLCVLPVGYAIVWLRPSWHCGPFSQYNRISEFITNTTRNALPKQLHEPLDYLTSSSTVIPLLLLLILIIYYLVSLTGALREANQDLRTQLQKEREEERKKIFKRPETKPAEPTTTTLTNRWRKVLEASSPVTPTPQPDFETEEYKTQARKELISRIMKSALRKGSATSDEDSVARHGRDDDDTDTEHHDSLPHDEETKEKPLGLTKLQQIRRTRKPSLVDIVQIAKSERERERASAGGATAATAPPIAGREARERRSRIERREKKDKEATAAAAATTASASVGETTRESKAQAQSQAKAAADRNEHDPEVNSRIVNERRQSLLRRKREEDEQKQQNGIRADTAEGSPAPSVSGGHKSNFEVIDEKKPLATPSNGHRQQQPPQQQPQQPQRPKSPAPAQTPQQEGGSGGAGGGSKFKLRRYKFKPANSNAEPTVFKFDEKSSGGEKLGKATATATSGSGISTVSSAHQLGSETSPSVGISTIATSSSSSALASTSQALGLYRPTNTEAIANLSRLGRKKIGSLLALVREAVNTKRAEEEAERAATIGGSPSEPTTPGPGPGPGAGSAVTAIEMPAPAIMHERSATLPKKSKSSSALQPLTIAATTSGVMKPPPDSSVGTSPPASAPPLTPRLARFDDLEELDQPGPIVFPQRSVSQRRPAGGKERHKPIRQDSQSSVWSDNIPTITISTTGSDECILEAASSAPTCSETKTTTTSSPVNIIKINIEDDDDDK